MKIRLLRDARIKHRAGEIVEVSQQEATFLMSIKSAEAAPTETKKKTVKK